MQCVQQCLEPVGISLFELACTTDLTLFLNLVLKDHRNICREFFLELMEVELQILRTINLKVQLTVELVSSSLKFY